MDSRKISYAQSGEDVIIDFIFDSMKIDTRRYLDIGAHHASYLSNTFYFYQKGFTGVCVEPDPELCAEIEHKRPNDTCLNVGISNEGKKKVNFFLLDPSTLNTFSEKEVALYQEHYPWVKVRDTIKVNLFDVNNILKQHFKNGVDLVSVDTEGMDFEIIKGIDFGTYKPTVICVETAVYTKGHALKKNSEIVDYLRDKGYFVYADTFVNTIFVDYETWKKTNGTQLEGF